MNYLDRMPGARAGPAFLGDLLDTLTERGRALLGREGRGAGRRAGRLATLGEPAAVAPRRGFGRRPGPALLAAFVAARAGGAARLPQALAGPLRSRPRRVEAAIEAIRRRTAGQRCHRGPARRGRAAAAGAAPAPEPRAGRHRGAGADARGASEAPARAPGTAGAVDADFAHLFGSWFNRGFLVLRPIDWTTPANILEKIIRYEAVHAIQDWDDLRNRLEPADRRCFGFFHPQLVDEPLIFVEVALTQEIPPRSRPLLDLDAQPIAGERGDDRGLLLDLQQPAGPGAASRSATS